MTENNKSLEIAKQFVDDLYDFRDNYFNDFENDLNAFKNKQIDVNNKLEVNPNPNTNPIQNSFIFI